jgi:hypothetical protein
VHGLLPQLYSAALLLPDTDAEAQDCEGQSTNPALGRALSKKLLAFDYYREVFDPYAGESEKPVVGSLSDDLADIYGELAKGLACWDAGNRSGAMWEWRFGFQTHWGEHLTGAMRALYWCVARSGSGGNASTHSET